MTIEPPLPDALDVDEEIRLRRSFDTPAAELHALIHCNLEHLGRFMAWARADYSVEGVAAFQEQKRAAWNRDGDQPYSILYRGELAGAIGIRGFETVGRAVMIGYWLSAHLEGNGIVTRSVAALIRLAFERQGMNQVIIRAAPHNTRSRAIPERLGFTETGYERQVIPDAHGELLDLVCYSLLKSEWEA